MRFILMSLRLIEVARLRVTSRIRKRMAVVVVDCVIKYIYIYIQFFL